MTSLMLCKFLRNFDARFNNSNYKMNLKFHTITFIKHLFCDDVFQVRKDNLIYLKTTFLINYELNHIQQQMEFILNLLVTGQIKRNYPSVGALSRCSTGFTLTGKHFLKSRKTIFQRANWSQNFNSPSTTNAQSRLLSSAS